MPTLTIKRDTGYTDRSRSYRVLLDGRDLGRLSQGGELHSDISAERHMVEARIDWCGSQPLHFDAVGDHVVVVRSALRGWRSYLALFYIIFNRRGYLVVELESGRADAVAPGG